MAIHINPKDLPTNVLAGIKVAARRVTLELPYPPSTNRYWRHVGHKVLISAEGRAYRKTVAAETVLVARVDGRLRVEVLAYPPDRRRRDLDNALKCLLDSIKDAGIFHDDEQIDDLRIMRRDVFRGGKVVVTIERLEAA